MENKNIALKIVKVMAAVQSVSKDGFNAFHKYKYVTDAAIVNEIRKEMIANKLVCIPSQQSCDQVGDLTKLLVSYTLLDADSGETYTSMVYGYGQDKGDKGVYKAATGAEKYYLLKTFLLPTDDDPENEKEGNSYRQPESDEGYDTGIRVPAGYWDLDEKSRQERIGKGFYPKKTAKGWFIFSREKVTEADLPRESKSVLIGAPDLKTVVKEDYISHQEQLEIFRQVKEKGVHHLTFKKALKDEFGIDGTAKITKELYPKVIEYIIKHSNAEIGQ